MRRLRLLRAAILALVTLIALDAILVFTLGAISLSAYREGDHRTAIAAAGAQAAISPWQRHRPLLTSGTARAAEGDDAGAQADLERALAIAPPSDRCPILINLMLVVERRGLGDGADPQLDRARELSEEITSRCSVEDSQDAEDALARLEGAQEEPEPARAAPEQSAEPSPEDRDRREQAIRDRSAQADRAQEQADREDGGSRGPRVGADRPW